MGKLLDSVKLEDKQKIRFEELTTKANISEIEAENGTEDAIPYRGYTIFEKVPNAFNTKAEVDEYIELTNNFVAAFE